MIDAMTTILKLGNHTLLQCAPELRMKLTADLLTVTVGERSVGCSPRALGILHALRQPATLQETVSKFDVNGVQDWIDLVTEIHKLHEIGALVEPGRIIPAEALSSGFGALPIHTVMLNDRDRTAAYLQAIRETVCPGDVVVEIGAGTGVLSIAAALAGAKRVYAIEATGIAVTAERMIAANQVGDRVTLIQGWSTQVDLPERADVLISETIGDSIFEERILEGFRDATRRFLKPDARLIPQRIEVFALLLNAPTDKIPKPTLETVTVWREWYGIDFTPLVTAGDVRDIHRYIAPHEAHDWQTLAEPILLAAVDLASVKTFSVEADVSAVINVAGELNAIMLYPDVWLSPMLKLSRHPDALTNVSNWSSLVSFLAQTVSVAPKMQARVQYRQGAGAFVLTARRV
jgi:hypothetical protein